MTKHSNNKTISEVLWSNSKIDQVCFVGNCFNPTHEGHGLFVKTEGDDVLIDLRLASEKPFLGHSHPLSVQHSFGNLEFSSEEKYYSVSRSEYREMTSTFQQVHFSELLSENFKIEYHNIVVVIDESIIVYDITQTCQKISEYIRRYPDTFFWVQEKDLGLIHSESIFKLRCLLNTESVHLCIDMHFMDSIFIHSHHLFSEDRNIHFFLAVKYYIENIISNTGVQKDSIDFLEIEQYFNSEIQAGVIQRQGRYLILNKSIDNNTLLNNGILVTSNFKNGHTVFAIPLSCTKDELIDTLKRIKEII